MVKKHLHSMFIIALFKVTKKWKQPKCTLLAEWIKKMWHINKIQYYSATKNECLSFSRTWVELFVLCITSQAKK